jgi:hypothetical protein
MTRKLKLVPKNLSPEAKQGVDIADALNNQIQFANGLALAILGEAHISEFDCDPISQLVQTNIEKLETIARSFEQLRATL